MITKQLQLFRALATFAKVRPETTKSSTNVLLHSEIYIRKSHKMLHNLYQKESPIETTQQIMKDFSQTLGQRYQHGFQPDEMANATPALRKAFSLNNATDGGIVAYRIQQAIEKYQKWPLDTGSALVKAAVLCEKVISMMNHMEHNRQDKYGALQMTRLLADRRKALFYLRIHDYQGYLWLIKDYGLKEIKYHNHDYLKYKHVSATKTKRYTRIDRNKSRWAL